MAIIIPFIIYYLTNKEYNKKVISISIISLCILFIYQYITSNIDLFLDSTIFRRLAKTYLEIKQEQEFMSGREELWEYAIKLFKSSPLIGVGDQEFVKKFGTLPHNTYLQVLCERGIIGIILFIIPLIYCLFKTIRLCRNNQKSDIIHYLYFSLSIQLFYILYGFTGNTNNDLVGYIMYAISIAILINCKQYNKKVPL